MSAESAMRNVLVTGVGGGVGQSVIKALRQGPYGVVGMDAEPLAAGLHAVPRACLGFYAADPRFVDRVIEVCRQERCGLVFPGHDVELLPLAAQADRVRAAGIVPVVSQVEVVRTCDDKLATQAFLRAHGFPALPTRPLREVASFPGPAVLKPRQGGARSRATYAVRTPREWDLYRPLVDADNCVVQEYVEGDEYTCGSVTLDGKCAGVIVMRRTLRDGDTYKAFVERNPRIEALVRDVVTALQPFGACNLQLRVRGGEPFVFEINARCSGTTAARALAGFNEPVMIAGWLLDRVPPRHEIREIAILRYWQELVVPPACIEELRAAGSRRGDGQRL
jgi:carbamoyl-phosphate synthase large subunit